MDLVLVVFGEPASVSLLGDAAGVVALLGRAEDVDTLVDVADGLDWSAWVDRMEALPASPERDAEVAAVRDAERAHASGALRARLEAAVAAPRRALAEEHAKHQAIFQARKGR